MIITRVGRVWYMTSKGKIRRCNELVEDLAKWEEIGESAPDFEMLKAEIGASIMADIKALAPREASAVKQVALEDPITVAKFDTWHAVVSAKKPSGANLKA